MARSSGLGVFIRSVISSIIIYNYDSLFTFFITSFVAIYLD